MKTHLLTLALVLFGFLSFQANADDAVVETHRETERIVEPLMNKIDQAEDRAEQQFKNDPDDADEGGTPAKGGATNATAKTQAKNGDAGGLQKAVNTQSTQKRMLNTGEIGEAGGAKNVQFDKGKAAPVIPADAVY